MREELFRHEGRHVVNEHHIIYFLDHVLLKWVPPASELHDGGGTKVFLR